MAIYSLLESENIPTENLVMDLTGCGEMSFSILGCDSCNHNSITPKANNVMQVCFADVMKGDCYEFQLCESCIYEFEYPNESQDSADADEFYESLSSHAIPDASDESTKLPCGNNLFYYLQGDTAILYVSFAILAGCESPDEIENWVFTHYPGESICTNSSLENVAYIAHKLLNTESSIDAKSNVQFGYDCLVQEMTDSLNRR